MSRGVRPAAREIAAALWRVADAVRAYEQMHALRDEPPLLAQRRAGQRQAAVEIREWVEEVARGYQERGEK